MKKFDSCWKMLPLTLNPDQHHQHPWGLSTLCVKSETRLTSCFLSCWLKHGEGLAHIEQLECTPFFQLTSHLDLLVLVHARSFWPPAGFPSIHLQLRLTTPEPTRRLDFTLHSPCWTACLSDRQRSTLPHRKSGWSSQTALQRLIGSKKREAFQNCYKFLGSWIGKHPALAWENKHVWSSRRYILLDGIVWVSLKLTYSYRKGRHQAYSYKWIWNLGCSPVQVCSITVWIWLSTVTRFMTQPSCRWLLIRLLWLNHRGCCDVCRAPRNLSHGILYKSSSNMLQWRAMAARPNSWPEKRQETRQTVTISKGPWKTCFPIYECPPRNAVGIPLAIQSVM